MEETIINLLVQAVSWALGTSAAPYIVAGLTVIGALVTIATVVVPFTKTPKDDAILAKIKAVFQRFSVLKPKA